jgi:hypothetical protein
MDFCNNSGGGFISSVINSSGGGGSDPDVTKWGAKRLNLSMADVQQTIAEGKIENPGVAWDIDGNKMLRMNN